MVHDASHPSPQAIKTSLEMGSGKREGERLAILHRRCLPMTPNKLQNELQQP